MSVIGLNLTKLWKKSNSMKISMKSLTLLNLKRNIYCVQCNTIYKFESKCHSRYLNLIQVASKLCKSKFEIN